jgi:hypothetical protein
MNRALAILICMLAMASCSGDSSGPADDGGGKTEQFAVSYAVENDRSAEETIAAVSGGTVEATGSNGVVYRLTVPAGALATDTLVTITPVSDLAVTGPGTFTCASSCPEIDCCVTGALFEPEGLEFDTLVTLEIIFPAGEEFPFDSTAGVFMFDSPYSVIGTCESDVDFAAKTLTAKIWHFTGYGTAASDCERLTGLYLGMKANAEAMAGTRGFFYDLYSLVQLISLNRACDPAGISGCHELCEGLNTLVMAAAQSAVGSHRSALLLRYPASPTSPGEIEDLTEELDRAQYFSGIEELSYDMQNFREAVTGRILAMAQTLAAEARSLCSARECLEGHNLLYFIKDLGAKGYITDAAFMANVETWIEDCCGGWRLSMSIDKSEILRAVINPGDEDMCVATVTLKLTTSSGEPVEGVYLDVDLEDGVNLAGGDSDENGEYEVSFSSVALGYGERFYCVDMLQKEITSSVYDPERSETVEADPIIVTFRNFTVSTTVNYSYTAVKDEDAENHGTTTCTIIGGGTNYANTIGNCETTCTGVITRSFNSAGCTNGECGETIMLAGAEATGCLLRPNLDYVDRGDGVRIPVLLGLNFLATPITDGVHLQSCLEGDCVDFWTDLRSRVEWPGYGGIPEYWEISAEGAFEPLHWTFSETSETSSKEATLTISVEASH